MSPFAFGPLLLAACLGLASSLGAAAFRQPPAAQPLADEAGLLEAEARVEDDRLVIRLRAVAGAPTAWHHVFLDADGPGRGFRHSSGAPAGRGLDFLIEGDAVYRFSGSEADLWSWSRLPGVGVQRSVEGGAATLSLPVAALALPADASLRGFAVTYTDNYAASLDTLPRSDGAWSFSLLPVSARSDGASALPAPAAETPLPPRADAREAFRRIRSYACYYGAGRTAELLARDAVIIETAARSAAEVNTLRAAGRVVVGYISIGEDHHLRPGDGQGPGGMDSAYFDRDRDGRADRNGVWNSYYTNAAAPSWRAWFLRSAARLRETHGVDGFFLDTVETCLLYPESREGMVSLIRELRAAHPDAVIVLNRGWDLLPALGDTPDGVMFESFTLSYDFGEKRYELMRPSAWDYGLDVWRRLLLPAREQHGVVLLALDYAGSADDPHIKLAHDRAVTLGFVPFVTSIMLDSFYDIAYPGVRDERWLRPAETTEARTVVLPEARNGFPAGTRFFPDSNHGDYTVAPVLDGVPAGPAREALGWRDRAWASLESSAEHWLEFALPAPLRAGRLEIEWAWDNGLHHPAREFRVEIQPAGAVGQWSTIARFSGNASPVNLVALPAMEFTGLRVVQAAGGGGPARPDLMWVQQIRLLP